MRNVTDDMRALVACDEPVTRRELEQAFLDGGVEVMCVRNGREALENLRNMDVPQLAVLDGLMPGMDGAALTERLRADERFKSLFIILLTQESDNNAWRRARNSGADDALSKPVHAGELALRLDLWKRFQVLKQLADSGASHDQVTGLYSHGLILETAQHELDRAAREQMPLSVLLTDVDHLRQINDAYGHQMGDKVLAEVARRLKVALRSYDLSGRYGGEEFLTVLPRCGRANAIEVGERVRRAMLAGPFEIDRLKLDVTVSIGVATTMGDEHVLSRKIIRAADHALYKAKREGRNRVEMAVSLKTWAGRSI
ncbi:MAG TPA: diguanylate cyclase [Gammaproteobacteria bacterium]